MKGYFCVSSIRTDGTFIHRMLNPFPVLIQTIYTIDHQSFSIRYYPESKFRPHQTCLAN